MLLGAWVEGRVGLHEYGSVGLGKCLHVEP
jgi:hypothetical protein